ncbi:MFS transporter [Cryobacterium frigoriphilum]|uniref:Putative proline/betaine transporter n=1 Tax=Cryobacterium frigoriphilum TaxID=1259150 RepID=A0A4V3IQH2_9MICO|nr:MFS transporter [Cryobacterium frigoriphilum]TFD45961.1 MFS transporter [Cryobacterium frigoriphilum]
MAQESAVLSPTVRVIDLKASRRALIAGSLGNVIEWYEYAIYGFMAPIIAPLFFPSADPTASILFTFMVFALAFFLRPIGAVIFGRLTDSRGRRPVLVAIILIMSIATTAIGLLPTVSEIGMWATVILVLCRIAQGLSGGGEMGGAVSLMIENAPEGKRGLYGSWSFFGTSLGYVLGGGVATLLAVTLSAEDLADWGWRIGFLLAAPMGISALIIRLKVDETPHFKEVLARRAAGDTTALAPSRIRYTPSYLMITVAVLVVYNALGNTFQVGMPTFLSSGYGMSFVEAYGLSLVTGLVGACSMPIFGALSDRVGRAPVLLFGTVATLVLSYPLYLLIGLGFVGGLFSLFVAGLLIGIIGGPMPAFLSERFPTRDRATGVAVVYAVSVAIFGGSAPYIITYILLVTQNPLAASFYTIFVAAISLVGLIALKRSQHQHEHLKPLED